MYNILKRIQDFKFSISLNNLKFKYLDAIKISGDDDCFTITYKNTILLIYQAEYETTLILLSEPGKILDRITLVGYNSEELSESGQLFITDLLSYIDGYYTEFNKWNKESKNRLDKYEKQIIEEIYQESLKEENNEENN